MESVLIVGGGREERKQKAYTFAQKYRISPFDRLVLEPESPTKRIGIEQIRTLRGRLALRPFNSPYKIAILVDFERATEEAQNAFLKTLEEPPNNTIIVLTSLNADLLLPTIVSRCQVISLPTTVHSLPKDQFSTLNSQLSTLMNGRVGEKLKLAQDLSGTRDESLVSLEKIITSTHQQFLKLVFDDNPRLIPQYLNILKLLQNLYKLLSTTNVSPRLTLETSFLGL